MSFIGKIKFRLVVLLNPYMWNWTEQVAEKAANRKIDRERRHG